MTSKTKFWMIYSPAGRSPSIKHESFEKAVDEAKRLAGSHPHNDFYVLEAVNVFRSEPAVMSIPLNVPVPIDRISEQ